MFTEYRQAAASPGLAQVEDLTAAGLEKVQAAAGRRRRPPRLPRPLA
jgi:hypothetical protein